MAPVSNPSTQDAEAGLRELKASLGHTVNSSQPRFQSTAVSLKEGRVDLEIHFSSYEGIRVQAISISISATLASVMGCSVLR